MAQEQEQEQTPETKEPSKFQEAFDSVGEMHKNVDQMVTDLQAHQQNIDLEEMALARAHLERARKHLYDAYKRLEGRL